MDNQNNKNNPNNNRQGWGIILVTTLLVTFMVMGFYSLMSGAGPEEISYDKFLDMVDDKKVAEVSLSSNRIYITLTDEARRKEAQENGSDSMNSVINQIWGQTGTGGSRDSSPDYYTAYVNDDTLVERLYESGAEFKGEVPDTMGQMFFELFVTLVLPIGLMALVLSYFIRKMSKGGGMMGVGKSNAKMYMEKETGVTFQDVAGEDEAKESLQEVVDFLHNPGR